MKTALTITSRGVVTLPAKLRREMGLKADDQLIAETGDTRTAQREVPEIRLSGAWLERIGFPKGARYLISVEREFRTIILQASFEKERPRRS